jgi:hypothetical protein
LDQLGLTLTVLTPADSLARGREGQTNFVDQLQPLFAAMLSRQAKDLLGQVTDPTRPVRAVVTDPRADFAAGLAPSCRMQRPGIAPRGAPERRARNYRTLPLICRGERGKSVT